VRVLLLAPHPFFQQRGTPIAEKMLLEVLSANGHEVEVLTFAEGEDPGIPGCRIHRLPHLPGVRGIRPGFSVKKLACDAVMLWKCLGLVRRGRYDLVHAVEESAFMALAARLLFRVPYVYDMDSGLARQMVDKFPPLAHVRRLLTACESLAVRGSAGTLAVCKSLEEQARACHPGGLVACIEDVSLLGDLRGCAPGAADDLTTEDLTGHPVVMYVGNLERYQGIDLLVEAFARALPEVPEARLVVIGGEPAAIEAYRARCAGLGIAEAVLFAGPRPVERLGAYLQRATVLVSPRIHGNNTPMKVYSYLDSGRALLATRLPTHTQVLTDEIACLVAPEPEAMARGLVGLLRDGVLRERLAANAREMAQRELTPQAFERKLLRFYDQVAQAIGGEWPDGKTQRLEAGRPGAR
jgi:glycosyltransferase involved in cell wall biosynthesis